jgi:hypothetical protein
LALLTALAGCARPQGELFPSITPPRVWPPPPEEPRIRLVGTIIGSRDLRAARSGLEAIQTALRGPLTPVRFSAPQSLAIRDRRWLAVADGRGAAIHLINLDARTHTVLTGFSDSAEGESPQRFGVPMDAAWVGDRLFVTDAQRREVIELDAAGACRGRFGAPLLDRPVGILFVAQRGLLCVADGGAHCLRFFDLSGRPRGTVGRRGAGPGEFNFPSYLCCFDQHLLVCDAGNARVQVLDLDGNWKKSIGRKGDGAGDFALPKGIACDSQGHIYVVDAQFENVQIFDRQGRLLMAFGREGRGLGEFWLPAGIAIDEQDRIWVADAGNRRLQVFQYLGGAS